MSDEENSGDEDAVEMVEDAGKSGGFFKKVFWIGVLAGVGVGIAYAMNQRQKLAAMSDEEIRAMLDEKLGGRVQEEQLVQIQDAVISKVRGTGLSGAENAAVTGTVTYREDTPMPEDAVVIVKLEDSSLMDVPAGQIGVQIIESPGNVPVPFTVGFKPAEIVDRHAYSVRATITSGDDLLWTTDTQYPVITSGNPLTADLLLISVPQPVGD